MLICNWLRCVSSSDVLPDFFHVSCKWCWTAGVIMMCCFSLTCSPYSVCSSCAQSWPTVASWPCPSRRTGPNTWSKYTRKPLCLSSALGGVGDSHRPSAQVKELMREVGGGTNLADHSAQTVKSKTKLMFCLMWTDRLWFWWWYSC